jgi:hypothetical protein
MGTDSTEIVKAVKDKHDGSRDIELVMDPETGEMVAVPKNIADNMGGVKAGKIATQDYYF